MWDTCGVALHLTLLHILAGGSWLLRSSLSLSNGIAIRSFSHHLHQQPRRRLVRLKRYVLFSFEKRKSLKEPVPRSCDAEREALRRQIHSKPSRKNLWSRKGTQRWRELIYVRPMSEGDPNRQLILDPSPWTSALHCHHHHMWLRTHTGDWRNRGSGEVAGKGTLLDIKVFGLALRSHRCDTARW